MIKKEDDKLVIENPGSIRTGKKQMLRGGISDPRNKTLMKMFNMIKDRSIYNFGVDLDEDDKILTLSTCADEYNKYVVHAVLLDD